MAASLQSSDVSVAPGAFIAGVAAILLVATCLLFPETALSISSIWNQSDTYSHGIAVIPMAAWAMWRIRRRLDQVIVTPFWPALVLVAGSMLTLWFSRVVGVQFFEQLAMYAFWVSSVLALIGWRALRVAAFPIGFCVFAIPFGEFLVPPLMDVTADLTVKAVELSGIPVYRSERFFSLPSGDFEVVEACSGIRFLVVTVVLAVWLAETLPLRLLQKIMFVGFAGVVMTLANAVRAYVIVLLVHYSGGRIGTGFDHIVYGWVAFFLGFLVIVYVANLVRHRFVPPAGSTPKGEGKVRFALPLAISLLVLVGSLSFSLFSPPDLSDWQVRTVAFPSSTEGVLLSGASDYPGVDLTVEGQSAITTARYEGRNGGIDVIQIAFDGLDPSVEMVSWRNRILDESWRVRSQRAVALDGIGAVPLEQRVNGAQELYWARWFLVGDHATSSPVKAKLLSAWRRISGGPRQDTMIVVFFASSLTDEDIHAFLTASASNIVRCVTEATTADCVVRGID